MKPILLSLLFITLLATLSCSSCKKETVVVNPASQLPAATQTGANTFGCLINGVAFTPKGYLFGAPSLLCAYQFIQNKGYNFQLSADDFSNSSDVTGVGVYTDSMRIKENTSYSLITNNIPNSAYGLYSHVTTQDPFATPVYTKTLMPGSLSITRYDSIKQIVSGTFWFYALTTKGDTIKITDGRFDMQYTK